MIHYWQVGKPFKELAVLEDDYIKRLKAFIKFDYFSLQASKNSGPVEWIQRKESELILNKLKADDYLVLLDEKGTQMNSVQFAAYLEKLFYQSAKRIIFVSGGAYGFSEQIRLRSNALLSLSSMTFSHRLIKLIFLEQLYRAMTILHHHPYHNE